MNEIAGLVPALCGVIMAGFIAWIVSRDKLSRAQCEELAREIAKDSVKPFTGGLQMIEDQWNETFERMKLSEGRIAARLRKEEKLAQAREDGGVVDGIMASAKAVEGGPTLAESTDTPQAKRDAMLKKHLATRAAVA